MPSPRGPDSPPPARAGLLLAWGLGLVCAVGLALLLARCLFLGRAQSFDPMLYARGLWGLARGDVHNPVLGLNTFAIHAHLLGAALAPLTLALPAALVLVLGQAAAWGVVVAQVSGAAYREARAATAGAPAALVALWAAAVVALLSPLVVNPFFFDARPDVLGVPFAVGALLRARERGRWDPVALVLLALAALAREELALMAAAALAIAPIPGSRRFAWAAAFVGYFALYYFVVRALLGGTGDSAAAHLQATGGGLGAKAQLAAVAASTAGGLVWLGGRWALAALPGVAMLLLSGWMVDQQVRFHYGMFAAPALIAGALAGLARWLRLPARRRLAAGVAFTAVALVVFRVAGSAPGGRRFPVYNFELAGRDGGLSLDWGRRGPGVAMVHARLAALPEAHGLAVPWQFGAPLADRRVIEADVTFNQRLRATGAIPAGITTVALWRADAAAAAEALARAGFRPVGRGGAVEILSRDPALGR